MGIEPARRARMGPSHVVQRGTPGASGPGRGRPASCGTRRIRAVAWTSDAASSRDAPMASRRAHRMRSARAGAPDLRERHRARGAPRRGGAPALAPPPAVRSVGPSRSPAPNSAPARARVGERTPDTWTARKPRLPILARPARIPPPGLGACVGSRVGGASAHGDAGSGVPRRTVPRRRRRSHQGSGPRCHDGRRRTAPLQWRDRIAAQSPRPFGRNMERPRRARVVEGAGSGGLRGGHPARPAGWRASSLRGGTSSNGPGSEHGVPE